MLCAIRGHFGEAKLTIRNERRFKSLKQEQRFTDAAIAQALTVLEDCPPSMLGGEMSGAEREKTPLFEELQRVAAQCWLVADGDHWALRLERRRPGHEIIRWRGVTMLVPPSIVVGAALSKTERSHPRCVQVLPDSIAPQEPVGHLHVHLSSTATTSSSPRT